MRHEAAANAKWLNKMTGTARRTIPVHSVRVLLVPGIAQRKPSMRTPLQIALAAGILLGASGCRLLQEHPGRTAYVGDSAINARVEMALVGNPQIEAQEIDVHTFQGTVTLDGVVDSASMAQRAEQITRTTPGVRAVDSRLQVASSSAPRPARSP